MSRSIAGGHIDVHAHVVLEATLGAAGAHGPEIERGGTRPVFRVADWRLEGVDYRGTAFMDADVRVARMDQVGIGHQALTPNPLTWFHHIDPAAAVRYCRLHNAALAEHISEHPDRLSGLAQLPAQDPAAAARELAESVEVDGLSGGAMGTDPGVPLDDPSLEPIWAAAEGLDVPIFLHPAPAGIDGPVVDERSASHDFDLHGWFCHEETLAVVALVVGGVLDRHRRLDVCISHGGGSMALLYERIRHAMATRPSGSGDPDDIDRGLARLWFDNHVGDLAAAQLLETRVGTDQLVLGTNFAGWDDCGPEAFGVDATVLRANAIRLLRLDR
ncbi:MAG TPA: amidohydrolase family protein [Acidimicrobiales bacterium]|nr:amidohydrolase family protein [Acidimicrobiales bacterium]